MAAIDLQVQLEALLGDVGGCTHCKEFLPLGPRPVLRAHTSARVLIVGQAPGTRVHETGIPWNDPSGVRLRQWLDVTLEQFYDPSRFAIIPMGFCYPGRTRGGDSPARPECAPLVAWTTVGTVAQPGTDLASGCLCPALLSRRAHP